MGEGEVMIQRWEDGFSQMNENDQGEFITWNDHVAALEAATRSALQEESGAYDHGYCIGYAAGYSRGIVGVGKGLGDFCQVDECAGCGE